MSEDTQKVPEDLIIKMKEYLIARDENGDVYIECRTCGKESYNEGDIAFHFCQHCDRFHDDD